MTNVIDFMKRHSGVEIEVQLGRCPHFLSQMLEEDGFETYPDYVWIAATQMVDGEGDYNAYSVSDGDNGVIVLYRKLPSLGKVITLSILVEDIQDAEWLDVIEEGRNG